MNQAFTLAKDVINVMQSKVRAIFVAAILAAWMADVLWLQVDSEQLAELAKLAFVVYVIDRISSTKNGNGLASNPRGTDPAPAG